jgi:hypothetical protein
MAGNSDLDVPKLTSDFIVLGIRLLGTVTGAVDTLVARLLAMPDVLSEIQKQLDRITQLQFSATLKAQTGKALVEALRTPGLQKPGVSMSFGGDQPLQREADTSQLLAKALLGKVKELDQALSKGGVWYDRATHTLYLVAAGGTLDRVLSMYVLNGGHFSTDLPAILSNRQVKFLQLGSYSLKGEAPAFTISPEVDKKQDPEWKTLVTADWKPIQVSLTVGSKILGDHVEVIDHGELKVVIPVGVKITPKVKVGHTDDKGLNPVTAGLEVSYEKGKLKIQVTANVKTTAQNLGKKPGGGDVKGEVEYKTRSGVSLTFSGGLSGKSDEKATKITGWEIMGGLKVAKW